MQKLHLVGFTAEFDGLIFSTRKGAKSGDFVVPIDGRLLKQIAEAERLRDGGSASRVDGRRSGSPRLTRPESALTPREIQDRVRAGWSVDEVATEAGVDLDWISRFAAPVLAEVGQVIEQAREMVYDKPRFGASALPLGASVRRNVVERGVRMLDEEFDDCWSAYQLDEDAWVVRFVYLSRGREQEAEWRVDLGAEELTSRNRLGSQLGHVVKGKARRTVESNGTRKGNRKPPPAPKPAVAKSATKAAPRATVPAKAAPRSSAPRKKAASRPAKKPAKKRPEAPAVVIVDAPEPPVWVRPQPAPRPAPVAAPAPTPAQVRRPAPAPVPMPAPAPAPAPLPVAAPEPVDLTEPPQPGAFEVDESQGIARIDSRRTWHPEPSRPAVIRGEVLRAGDEAPVRRPRRSEPLRGR
jgi:hypothetical protein